VAPIRLHQGEAWDEEGVGFVPLGMARWSGVGSPCSTKGVSFFFFRDFDASVLKLSLTSVGFN